VILNSASKSRDVEVVIGGNAVQCSAVQCSAAEWVRCGGSIEVYSVCAVCVQCVQECVEQCAGEQCAGEQDSPLVCAA
jgi:hypothetical protein